MPSTRDVAILAAVRTPIGRAPKGTLRNTRPDDLGALVVREALARAEVAPAAIEDLVLGCAMPESEQGLNVARVIGRDGGSAGRDPGDDHQPVLLLGSSGHRHHRRPHRRRRDRRRNRRRRRIHVDDPRWGERAHR